MRRRVLALGAAVSLFLTLPAFVTATQAMKLKPFDTPPPDIDPAKIATLRPGTTAELDYDRVLMVGPKGYVIMKIGPKEPIPPSVQPAAPGIELRLIGYGTFVPSTLKQVDFMTRQSGEQRQVTAYLNVYAFQDRVAACGYFVRNDKLGFDSDFFFDPRSYLDVGGAFRLPTVFLKDQTSVIKRPDGKVGVRCVDSNIAWDPAYHTLPLSLHLEDKPLQFEWQLLHTEQLSPTRPVVPAPPPPRQSPYD